MPDEAVECPRCGYDLSGLAASWVQSCPLEGVCSECGLNIDWNELLSRRFAAPNWSFEHAKRRRGRAAIGTAARLFCPRRFWRELKLTHPVRLGRICMLVTIGALICQLFLSSVAAGSYWYAWWTIGPPGPPNPPFDELVRVGSWPFPTFREWIGLPLCFALLISMLMPPLFWALSDTLRMAKVRTAHIVRAGAYSIIVTLAFHHAVISALWIAQSGWSSYLSVELSSFGIATLALLPAVLWMGLWWLAACTRYMRLPQAWLAWVVLFTTASFAAFTIWFALAVFLADPNMLPWN